MISCTSSGDLKNTENLDILELSEIHNKDIEYINNEYYNYSYKCIPIFNKPSLYFDEKMMKCKNPFHNFKIKI
jgi:hypothetical protein